MSRTTPVVAALLAVLGSFPVNTSAQGVQTGSIRGTVVDPQNLPVPGVTVTLRSPALQGVRSTVTAGDGSYSFVQLPPGRYDLRYEIASFAPVQRRANVLLGLAVEQNVTLTAAARTEEIQVVAEAPAPIVNPTAGANYGAQEINALPSARTLIAIAQLAPGLTENTPNVGQLTINGAFAFDNVFMLNGVDVNDNLFGSPQNLFIEDAIEETQVLTSGISAEYGRFTGGVVNAITKSGGNAFSASWRTNFYNPSWTKQTPLELCEGRGTIVPATCSPARPRVDDLQFVNEMTLGGPLVRDRLWFFGAARLSEVSNSSSLPQTNIQNTQTDTNRRGEIKFTGTAASNHTIQGGYLNNSTEQESRPSFSFTIDPNAVGARTLPNWYAFANYRGILSNNLLVEAQYSQRKFKFEDSGGSDTNIVNSPFFTRTQRLGHYNAEFFDETDPESRNNYQFTGNVTHFLNNAATGRHELKVGYEFFRSQNTGGNSQSATNYHFYADYVADAAGNPVYDANNRIQPMFVPGARTLLLNWLPVRGATLNVDNHSLFAQDHIQFNSRWSADVGVRYERVRTEATGGLVGIDTDTWVPRFAAAYDIEGNGRQVVHATYGWYSGRYNEAQIGANTNVGTPNLLLGIYSATAPPGQGRSFAPGFDPANYTTVQGDFPTQNVFFDDNLSSAMVKEFSTSYGAQLLGGRAWAQAVYVHRDTDRIIEDFIDIGNGVTTIVQNGFDVGTFTNQQYKNTDIAWRQYDALMFQSRYNLTNGWTLNGHYTVQLKNDGNYEGEATNQPGVVGLIGDYAQIFNAARHFPDGRLDDFQRHKVRLWSIYNADLGRFGDISLSGLWRIDSATTFSFVAEGEDLTAIQLARLETAGYPDAPEGQDVFFGRRGEGRFKGFQIVDIGLGYNVPVFRSLRPWVKFDVFNLFNNQKLIAWDTTVTPNYDGALDAQGIPTTYTRDATFGLANDNRQFPVIPVIVGSSYETGGRTFRVAAGFRF